MTVFSPRRWHLHSLLLLGIVLTPSSGYAASLGTAQLIKWGCPTPTTGAPASYDFFGSQKLLRVVDAAGNDFEVHCIATIAGFHYEFFISFPNGNKEELSRCIYSLGFNDATLIYTGTLTSAVDPAGTPTLTVGSIEIVEHSNIEGTGLAMNMVVKPGGRDFHIVHDYRNGHRYRLNTIGGRANSTDILARLIDEPGSSIIRAGVSVLASQSDYGLAQAGDTSFRKLDDSTTLSACEDCTQLPSVDNPAKQLQFTRVSGSDHSGMVITDPELRGSSYTNTPGALHATVPAREGRKVATMAVEMTLFSDVDSDIQVIVDGETVEADFLEHDGMMRIAFPLDSSPHKVQVGPTEQSSLEGQHAESDWIWMLGIGIALALVLLLVLLVAFKLSRRG